VGSAATAADELQIDRRRPIETLGSALAASLVVHLAILAFLVAGGWGIGGGALWSSRIEGPLDVVLASTRVPADKKDAGAAVEITPAKVTELPSPQEALAAPRELDHRTPPDSQGKSGSRGRGSVPRVSVDDRVPRARFEEAFESGAIAGFPAEVESPVQLPGKLQVPYPRSALEARREGTVLAWAIVDRQGAVERMGIVAGQADFNEAVRATLAKTRLIPARDGGKPIPFYIMLEFDFRLGDRGGTNAISAAGK
jgi:TonB family protein